MLLTVARHATHHPYHPGGAATVPVAAPRVGAQPSEPAPDNTDRPRSLSGMVGQASLIEQLRTMLKGSVLRAVPPCHVLLDGPPGYGKSSLAVVVANQLGTTLHTLTGPMLRRPQDIVGVMLRLQVGDVLFVDEVHAASRQVLEVLYSALEDNRVPLLIGSGADARAHVAKLPHWVCVAATTAPGQLPEPFRARFGLRLTMQPYTEDELAEIVTQVWTRQGAKFAPDEPRTVAQRCKGTPRIALHLAQRCLDYAACIGTDVLPGMAAAALESFGIDAQGWDAIDHRILRALTDTFAGRAAGIDALSGAVGLDRSTIETREAALAQAGLISRTARGRLALPASYDLIRNGGV